MGRMRPSLPPSGMVMVTSPFQARVNGGMSLFENVLLDFITPRPHEPNEQAQQSKCHHDTARLYHAIVAFAIFTVGSCKPHPDACKRKHDGDDEKDDLNVAATIVRLGAQVAMPPMLPVAARSPLPWPTRSARRSFCRPAAKANRSKIFRRGSCP